MKETNVNALIRSQDVITFNNFHHCYITELVSESCDVIKCVYDKRGHD